ncbi:MAG: bifunctional adenosylcobinamide kinase/adenosylcobinamide-phosphate guanylyltransferase [Propionibacteriales bacterium]|nr:bifunctional adenosylcobinamide kinase/adenosylcobinamide-phosphate guanylyltransferase [Propionibacteriales bacterium]
MKVLVTGGVRSGKSLHAEQLLADSDAVTYVAAGPVYDDADWASRITAHRVRRPDSWTTEETHDIAAVVRTATQPVLVDCLGTWLTAIVDQADLWERPIGDAEIHVKEQVAAVAAALAETTQTVVLVTNEVGLGVVPAHRSGRLFRDLLGIVNQRVAAECDEVHLVIAGRVLKL